MTTVWRPNRVAGLCCDLTIHSIDFNSAANLWSKPPKTSNRSENLQSIPANLSSIPNSASKTDNFSPYQIFTFHPPLKLNFFRG